MKPRKDGRYGKSIIDPRTGKRLTFYGKTESEVFHKILEHKEEERRGRTFETVATEYWNRHEPELGIQSKRTYRQALERAIEYFGRYRIQTITARDLTSFIQHVAHEGYSSRTVANQRMVLNQIFRHACLCGDLNGNPVQYVSVPRGLKKEKRPAASKEDEQRVLHSADIWIAPYIAIMTGMRRGEILALQWKDVDFERDLIRVKKSIAFRGNVPTVKEPKTAAGTRYVPLLKPLKEQLLKYRKDPDFYVISRTGKKPLTNTEYTRAYLQYQKITGVTASIHQLRHSFATIAFENGIPAKTIQEILGHAQLSTTMDIYTDVREKPLADASAVLNAVLEEQNTSKEASDPEEKTPGNPPYFCKK